MKIIQKLLSNIIFFTLILTLIFTRSFFGLTIFGFRLGELFVAFGLLLLIFSSILRIINKNTFQYFPYKSFHLFLIFFIFSLFLNDGSLFSTYTFKSSSFIWMIGYIFVGYYFFQNIKLTNIHIYTLSFIPYIIYLFNWKLSKFYYGILLLLFRQVSVYEGRRCFNGFRFLFIHP